MSLSCSFWFLLEDWAFLNHSVPQRSRSTGNFFLLLTFKANGVSFASPLIRLSPLRAIKKKE